MPPFKLHSPFKPTGDQPQAIDKLVDGLQRGLKEQTLLGVTGSGKTFTMASIVERTQRPTLILAHNKTLAAQLASEFRLFFPDNAVQYFVSYYDYYQPEAYVPRSDTYIAKESTINEEIDKLRHAATMSLLTRPDVLIVATVSCIYGLGTPTDYAKARLSITRGDELKRKDLLHRLVKMHYERNEVEFKRGIFRARGDVLEVFPAYSDDAIKIEMFGDTIEAIRLINPLNGHIKEELSTVDIYPATHYITYEDRVGAIADAIKRDLDIQVALFRSQNKLVEAQRIEERTMHDIEMLRQTGYCNGIENYSRYLDGRAPGTPPYVLLDYFPKDYLLFVDESHITIPQTRGMYNGDLARKQTLVDFGFRLPAARDNRPLQFDEFRAKVGQVVYVSATPKPYELERSAAVAEQLIRPTGLLDPTIEIKPTEHQVDDLIIEVQKRVKRGQRALVTTLTKRMAEDLTEYLKEAGIKVQYLHSEVETLQRLEILRDLRLGVYDVVVGINLLREGLDLPEVSLITILDADKEGFLRDETSLVQTIGRAARHVEGHVIMYADKITDSMRAAMSETERRRKIQAAYNTRHGITPQGIMKAIQEDRLSGAHLPPAEGEGLGGLDLARVRAEDVPGLVRELSDRMELAAQNLEFEEAARLRDEIDKLRKLGRKNTRAKSGNGRGNRPAGSDYRK